MSIELKGYEKLLHNIEVYGLHIIHVLEDEKGPGFTYSVGLHHNYQHPEIIIVGLKRDLAHSLINNIGDDIKNGHTYQENIFYDTILDGFECLMLKMDPENYDTYVGQALRFYDNNRFPVLQCVYPTLSDVYPWNDNWPQNLIGLQPLLGTLNS